MVIFREIIWKQIGCGIVLLNFGLRLCEIHEFIIANVM